MITSREELELLLAYLPEVRKRGWAYLMRLPTTDRILIRDYLIASGEIKE